MSSRVDSPEQFETRLAAALADDTKTTILYFFGTETLESGKSWCGDCSKADETIREKVKMYNFDMIEVPVGDRETWKELSEKTCFYRRQEMVPLKRIPTLVKIQNGRIVSDYGWMQSTKI